MSFSYFRDPHEMTVVPLCIPTIPIQPLLSSLSVSRVVAHVYVIEERREGDDV